MKRDQVDVAPGQVWADMDPRFGIGREVFVLSPTTTSRGAAKSAPAFKCAVFKDGQHTGTTTVINADRFRPHRSGYKFVRGVAPAKFDVGIRDVVQWLWSIDFVTTDSGDGTKLYATIPIPHAVIRVAPKDLVAESCRLQLRLAGIGIQVKAQDQPPCICASFDPVNDVAIIMLLGVTSEMIQRVSPANMRELSVEKTK